MCVWEDETLWTVCESCKVLKLIARCGEKAVPS